MLRQICDDTSDTVLIENNGINWKWVATLFWGDSIIFNESTIAGVISCCSVVSDARCIRALILSWSTLWLLMRYEHIQQFLVFTSRHLCEGLSSISQQLFWIHVKYLLLRLCTTCHYRNLRVYALVAVLLYCFSATVCRLSNWLTSYCTVRFTMTPIFPTWDLTVQRPPASC